MSPRCGEARAGVDLSLEDIAAPPAAHRVIAAAAAAAAVFSRSCSLFCLPSARAGFPGSSGLIFPIARKFGDVWTGRSYREALPSFFCRAVFYFVK